MFPATPILHSPRERISPVSSGMKMVQRQAHAAKHKKPDKLFLRPALKHTVTLAGFYLIFFFPKDASVWHALLKLHQGSTVKDTFLQYSRRHGDNGPPPVSRKLAAGLPLAVSDRIAEYGTLQQWSSSG